MGFLPEPFAFSACARYALGAAARRNALDACTTSSRRQGTARIRALGMPVVTTCTTRSRGSRHSFGRDRTLREALGTFELYPSRCGISGARLESVFTSSEVRARRIERDLKRRARRLAMWRTPDNELLAPEPSVPKATAERLGAAIRSEQGRARR